jgi:hypothetical protein
MDKDLKKKLTSTDKWIRLIFMVLFAVVGYVVQFIIWAIAAIQFIITLITGKPNGNLLSFGEGLSAFMFHILKYLTYVTEEKPYPFGSWPGSSKKAKEE